MSIFGKRNRKIFNVNTTAPANIKRKLTGKNKWLIAGSLLAILCFAAALFLKSCGEQPPSYDWQKFKQEVETLRTVYDRQNRQLYENFCRDIATAGDADFQKALNHVDGTISHFSSFNNCAKLIYSMARDKIKKSDTANELIVGVLSADIIAPCSDGTARALDILEIYRHKLQENDNRFRAGVAAALKKLPPDTLEQPAAEKFMQDLTAVNTQVKNIALETAFTTLGTAVEAVIIRQTLAAITRIAGRVVAKVSTSAAAPFLDGALPIGDVIAVAGFTWSAYDIYRLTTVLPQRMEKSLTAAIIDYRDSMRREILAHGKTLFYSADKSADEVLKSL